jgi:hypothetical protein
MMQDMYGLLEPTQSEKDAQEKKEVQRRASTTSSVNTQYIDEQIRRYENSQEMQQWKGALESTMNKKFPGLVTRHDGEGMHGSTKRAFDVFKTRQAIRMEQDNK